MTAPLDDGVAPDLLSPDPVDEQLAQPVTLQDPLTGYLVTTSVDIEKYNLLAQGYLDVSDGNNGYSVRAPEPADTVTTPAQKLAEASEPTVKARTKAPELPANKSVTPAK